MRQIYLASDSKARKKLLSVLGLQFKVFPSKIKEGKRAKKSYVALVKENALLKARDVAAKVNSGVVIAADTVCVQDGKIFGKPRDLADAHKMLKILSQKPQWLYTGIAVIDKDKNKTLVDYEKTKVYMDKLTDAQIENYFSQSSPLDKAGSFDIQDRGAFFIRRIEGCFYNVVGLPLRKLYCMLKALNIKLFMIPLCAVGYALCVFLSGCSTEYNIVTGQEESYYYSTDKEVAMGQAIAKRVDEEYKMAEDPLLKDRVETIGKKIAKVCDRKEIDYHFNVLDDEEVNAVSLPGGYIYINRGLIEKIDNDDQLAGVIAHEVGHIVARHSIKKLQASQIYTVLRVLTAAAPSGSASEAGSAADAAFTELMLGYSREDELLADQLAARYMKLAGYDPKGMITMLEKLDDISKRKPPREKIYFRTHPYISDRVRVVKQEIGENINFKDYINIDQNPHR